MHDSWIQQLEQWREFFLLAGTAGVALAGFSFVAMSIGSGNVTRRGKNGFPASMSPNALIAASVVFVSGMFTVPDLSQQAAGGLLCIGGIVSAIRLISARIHLRRHENGLPISRWIAFVALPYGSLALALLAGVKMLNGDMYSLPVAAAATILFILTGICNVWHQVNPPHCPAS